MNPDLIDMVSTLVAERLGLPKTAVPLDEDFANLGLASLDAVILSGLLEERLGYPIDPVVFIDNRTVLAVARALSEYQTGANHVD